jgi:hypothetical protein
VGTGLNQPFGVAVDAAGDVYIADTYNFQVVEVPAGCTSSACQTTVATGLNYPTGVGVAPSPAAPTAVSASPGNSQATVSSNAMVCPAPCLAQGTAAITTPCSGQATRGRSASK